MSRRGGGKYACKKGKKGPLVLSGRMRLIEGLTIGRVRKLNVGEGIFFNRMRTLAGDSCPSARPHINLLCVLDMGACTCSMHHVHPSLVSEGGPPAYFIHLNENSVAIASFITIKG